MRRRIAASVLAALCVASVAWTTTTTKNLRMTSNFAEGQSGWGQAMNANLNRLDSLSVRGVLPGEDLQAAVDSLPAAGGEIHLGAGTYTLSSTLRLDKPVKLYGAGQYVTFLTMDNSDSNIVEVLAPAVTIRDLCIGVDASSAVAGTGIGLVLKNYNTAAMGDDLFENVRVQHTGSWGVKLCGLGSLEAPDSSTGDVVAPQFNNLVVYNCKSGGALYAGNGVATPHFVDSKFVARGYTPAGTYSWKWRSVRPAYADYPDTSALQLGSVYLFACTAASFTKCSFELSGNTTDTPLLTLEDIHGVRLNDCYFEVDNARTQPMVTMSDAASWVFSRTYVRSPADAPLKFMATNTNPASICNGVIDGFLALHGSTSAAVDTSDFRFNSADATVGGNIVLRDVNIYNTEGRGFREASVLQGSGTGSFPDQNVLLQNTASRFAVPKGHYGWMSSRSALKAGEAAFVLDTLQTGSFGALMVVGANHNAYRVPFCPIFADTATRGLNYTAPREGDECYILSTHKQQVWDGTAWRDLH